MKGVNCSYDFIVRHIPTGKVYKNLDIITFTTRVVRVAYDLTLDLSEVEISIRQNLCGGHSKSDDGIGD
jgi:hypothetical protein